MGHFYAPGGGLVVDGETLFFSKLWTFILGWLGV